MAITRQKFLEKCREEDKYLSDERRGLAYDKRKYDHMKNLEQCTKVWDLDMRFTKNDVDITRYGTQSYYIKNKGEEFMSKEDLYDAKEKEHRLFSSFDKNGKNIDNRITHLDGFNTTKIFRPR